jgi:two-component system sensor histidine kinase UhpB
MHGAETDPGTIERASYARTNGLPFTEEFRIYSKSGKKICTRVQGQSMRPVQGNEASYFCIVTDITEEKRIMEERLQAEIEVQQKITHVILETRELERNELGRELHDNINQILAATHLQLSYSLANFRGCKPVLKQCEQNILEAMAEIRRLSHKMVMPRFSENKLPQVLQSLANNYAYASSIKLEMGPWNDDRVGSRIKEAFFRIAQEQLSNIYKHAKATQVRIRIENDARNAQLAVEDNGIGFDPAAKGGGIGISNIRSRVEACKGVSEFVSSPGKGCALMVSIPLDAA